MLVEFFKYATSSFWVFIGCLFLIAAIGKAINWMLCGVRGIPAPQDDD